MKATDIHRLYDIQEAADTLLTYFKGDPADVLTWNTTLRQLQLIGEACRKLTEETKGKAPHIPWHKIIATRRILVHEYGGIDPDIIVAIIKQYLPPLQAAVHTLIQSIDPQGHMK